MAAQIAATTTRNAKTLTIQPQPEKPRFWLGKGGGSLMWRNYLPSTTFAVDRTDLVE